MNKGNIIFRHSESFGVLACVNFYNFQFKKLCADYLSILKLIVKLKLEYAISHIKMTSKLILLILISIFKVL